MHLSKFFYSSVAGLILCVCIFYLADAAEPEPTLGGYQVMLGWDRSIAASEKQHEYVFKNTCGASSMEISDALIEAKGSPQKAAEIIGERQEFWCIKLNCNPNGCFEPIG